MKPLATNRQMLTWLCLLPAESTVTIRKKNQYIATISITFGLLVSCVLTYFLKFGSMDLKEALYAVCEMSACFNVILMTVAALYKRHRMTSFFEGLDIIYDQRKSLTFFLLNYNLNSSFKNLARVLDEGQNSFIFLENVNNKCEWMWRNYFKLVMKGFFIATVTISIISVFFCLYMYGNFDPNHLYYPARTM